MRESNTNSEEANKPRKADAIFQTGVRDEETRRAAYFAIAAALLGGCAALCLIFSSRAKFPSMILWQYACILFVVSAAVLGIASIISWIGSRESGHSSRLPAVAVKIFLFGVALFVFGICSGSRRLLWAFLVLSFIVAPALGIVGIAISVRGRGPLVRVLALLLIFILAIPLAAGGGVSVVWLLPRIYTPPSLTPQNLPVYKMSIQFLMEHDEEKSITWLPHRIYDKDTNSYYIGRFCTGTICEMLADRSVAVQAKLDALERAERKMTDAVKSRHRRLAIESQLLQTRLLKVGCVRFHRDSDMVLFYKNKPHGPFCRSRRLVTGPGVVYSLEGRNPNEVDCKVLNQYKPFTNIHGNWFTSRHLMLQGPRFKMRHVSLPETLVDYSLRTEGLDFGNGD